MDSPPERVGFFLGGRGGGFFIQSLLYLGCVSFHFSYIKHGPSGNNIFSRTNKGRDRPPYLSTPLFPRVVKVGEKDTGFYFLNLLVFWKNETMGGRLTRGKGELFLNPMFRSKGCNELHCPFGGFLGGGVIKDHLKLFFIGKKKCNKFKNNRRHITQVVPLFLSITYSRGVGLTEGWEVVSSVGHELRDKACNLHRNLPGNGTKPSYDIYWEEKTPFRAQAGGYHHSSCVSEHRLIKSSKLE